MKKISLIILAISYLFILNPNSFAQFGANKDLVKLDVFKSLDKVHADSEIKLAVKVNIEDTWHINSNKPNEEFLIPSELRIESKNFQSANIVFPKAEELNFSFSDKPVSVFEKEIVIGVLLRVPEGLEPGNYSVPVTLRYQSCNDQTCLPPTSVTKEVDIEVVNNSTPVKKINQEMFTELELSNSPKISESEEGSLGDTLESSGIVLSLILVFLGGLALNLTPCVYPLIPVTIGYFGGQSEGRTGKLFTLGILYVLGMALTYSVVGVITSLSGAVFGTLLQNPIVIIGVAAVLVALSLSMFGLYEFKMPDAWVNKAGGAKSGAFGAFFMGLTMGIVAAPCIGPFVIGLVTYVAAKGDPFYGFLMFFVLAVGLGVPYLFLALFSGKIKSLPKSGFWMDAVKHVFGFILVGMAIYFLLPLLSESYRDYILPIYMISASLYLLIFDKVANDIKGFRFFKIAFSIILIVVSVYLLIPSEKQSPNWETFSIPKYEAALNGEQKMIIDFYADWCIPCKELDAITFAHPEVINASKNFTMFKVDMTKTLSEKTEKIREKFNIVGMPTVLLIDSNGNEVDRITGFLEPEQFLNKVKNVD